jgi:hypothetical protein
MTTCQSGAQTDRKEFLKLHDELIASAPDELSSAVSLALDPTGQPVITAALCWCGPHDYGNTVLEPLVSHGRPILNQIGPVPYTDWQRDPDAGFPRADCTTGRPAGCATSPTPR